MNLQELSIEQLKEIDRNAPDGAEYYRSSNQTYYKFWHCNAWFYSELYEGWTTYPDLYNELKACENLIKLSDIRTAIAQAESGFIVGDRVVHVECSPLRGWYAQIATILKFEPSTACIEYADGVTSWIDLSFIRHATPEEIAIGHRIDELESLSLNMANVLSTINSDELKDDGDFTRFKNDMKYPVEPDEDLPELIVCAANRDPESGKVYLCVRHGCEMFWQQIDSEYGEDFCCQNFEEGFYTNHLRFVCREDAYIIANDNGQIKRLCPTNSNRLYSEMLY